MTVSITKEKRFLVLASLVDLNGAATKRDTLDNIEAKNYAVHTLQELAIKSNRNEVVWRNGLAFIRKNLVDAGYIDDVVRDKWEITKAGRQYLDSLAVEIVAAVSSNSPFQKLSSSGITRAQELATQNGLQYSSTTSATINKRQIIRQGVIKEANTQYNAGDFETNNDTDARTKIIAAIVRRQGQPAFRQKLLSLYNGLCAITRVNAEAALEAAHILPYNGPQTNDHRNGLLLRSDIHTLFDYGLIAIDSSTMTVIIAPELKGTTYASLQGVKLHLPANPVDHPSVQALDKHRLEAGI